LRRQENADRIRTLLSGEIPVVDFDEDDAVHAGDICAGPEKSGTPISPYDVLIAAQAKRIGAVVVTANRREFARVKGLSVKGWA
jgi:tRNA(fMet)-specific endonuclease VapC